MDHADKEQLTEIVRGAKLIFGNAEALFNEAEILGLAGHFARALVLHQISMEECSKIDMLGAAAAGMMIGHPLDLAKLAKKMARHEVKNRNNAYLAVETTKAERQARRNSDQQKASAIFDQKQTEFHNRLNTNKNASLYVDYVDGRFVAPSERITEALAVEIQGLNGLFLGNASLHLKLLQKMLDAPDATESQLKTVLASLEQLKDVPASEYEDRVIAMLRKMARPSSEEP